MVRYILKQCKSQISTIFGKWFAYPVIEQTVDLDGLADHMSHHNSLYPKGVIKGLLTDMISCIKELLLEGKGGATNEEEFSVTKNIEGVKLRARATGTLTAKALNLEATLKKATALTGPSTSSSTSEAAQPSAGTASGSNTGGGSGDNPGEGD